MIYDAVREWWMQTQEWYYKAAVIAALGIGLAGATYAGYYWFSMRVQKQAQQALADSLDAYNQAESSGMRAASGDDAKKMELWQDAELALGLGYEQNKHSTLAPYFLALQSDALSQQGKRDEALALLEKAVGMMKAKSSLRDLYEMKLALMYIDADDTRDNGLKKLRSLADDTKNIFRDAALYYLGRYYMAQGESDQAKEFFMTLIDAFPEQEQGASVWAQQAKTELGL